MALINREQALSHPFANGQYDKEHADEHFILGFEDYKEWLEDLPTVEAISKDQYEARLKADIVAMLEEIDLQFDEICFYKNMGEWKTVPEIKAEYKAVIKQKINELKGNEDQCFERNNINEEK